MRIKSDVEFVKRECEGIWMSEMADYCGQEVISYNVDRDGDYVCHFSNGGNWAYPPSCIEGLSTLEKGKKYTVNGSTDSFEFVEESENFFIFDHGVAVEKRGNTFTEYNKKLEFLNHAWRVERNNDNFIVYCGPFGICTIGESGLYPNKNISPQLGLPLDENGAVKIS